VKFGNNSGLSDIPKTFGLSQNYPNPFNPVTTIKYQLPTAVKVTIKIYDLLGREVQTLVNGVQEAGYYNIDWKALNFASGIYFYKIEAGNYTSVKKMVLLK
jgi:flagellar hook assembly protein FlgD